MIGFYYNQLRKKEREVERLNNCESSLHATQQKFWANELKCFEPELSTTTWHGKRAADFQLTRKSGIHSPYQKIASSQFSRVFDLISTKIASLQTEIASIKRIIEILQAEQAMQAKRLNQ